MPLLFPLPLHSDQKETWFSRVVYPVLTRCPFTRFPTDVLGFIGIYFFQCSDAIITAAPMGFHEYWV